MKLSNLQNAKTAIKNKNNFFVIILYSYMMLIESSKDEFIDAYGEEVNGFNGEDIKFYYIINNKLYCISCCN